MNIIKTIEEDIEKIEDKIAEEIVKTFDDTPKAAAVAPVPVAVTPPAPKPFKGGPLVIDLYHGDPITDITKIKSAGIIGVILKATQGGSYTDPLYEDRVKEFKSQGFLVGAYHFFDFTAVPKVQADHFLAVTKPDKDLLVALDWEEANGREPSAALITPFLEEIESRLGRKAVIYSGNVAKEQIKGKNEYLGSHRLWLAQYGTKWSVQESWTTPWLWQNNGDAVGPGPHTIAGIGGNCDNNTILPPMTIEQLTTEWAS